MVQIHEGAWQEVAENVYARRHEHMRLNVGLIVGDDECMLIDTRSWAAQAVELADAVSRITSNPIRHVVNTHGHFDHCFGNMVFKDAAIWGHKGCVDFLAETGENQRRIATYGMRDHAEDLKAVEIVPPNRLVETMSTILVGGRRIEMLYLGRGHTNHDIVVSVPEAGAIFAGDLLEEGAPPDFVDSYPLDWGSTLALLMFQAPDVFVPGHGDVLDLPSAQDQAAVIKKVSALCVGMIKGELSENDALMRSPIPDATMQQALRRARETAPTA